jgi:hypothetical protein
VRRFIGGPAAVPAAALSETDSRKRCVVAVALVIVTMTVLWINGETRCLKRPSPTWISYGPNEVETEDLLSTFAVQANIEVDTAETDEKDSKATLAEEKQMHASEKEQNDADRKNSSKDDQEGRGSGTRLICLLPFPLYR